MTVKIELVSVLQALEFRHKKTHVNIQIQCGKANYMIWPVICANIDYLYYSSSQQCSDRTSFSLVEQILLIGEISNNEIYGPFERDRY